MEGAWQISEPLYEQSKQRIMDKKIRSDVFVIHY